MPESIALPNPFQNILRLATGDLIGKALSFLAMVYLARVLGVDHFGVLEFAASVLTYLLMFADAGLEIWGTRESTKTGDLLALAERVVAVRILLACLTFAILLPLLPLFPAYPRLRLVLVLYGLCVFVQAVNLKWTFMGQQNMSRVARGLVLGQFLFAALVVAFIHRAGALVWVPVLRLAGDSATAVYFGVWFKRTRGALPLRMSLRTDRAELKAAFTLGLSEAMGLLTYNFDSILLGFLKGAVFVGWYNAAYRIILIPVTVTVTYFMGLFPALARAFAANREEFRLLVRRTLDLWIMAAVPLVIGGTFLAAPMIQFLYGAAYADSARPLQILVWVAGLVSIRYVYMDSLRASGHQALDLRCAIASSSVNVILCIVLIPRYAMIGAASATLASEIVWIAMAFYYFERAALPREPLPSLRAPLIGGAAMAAVLWWGGPLFWPIRAALSLAAYLGTQMLFGKLSLRHFFEKDT